MMRIALYIGAFIVCFMLGTAMSNAQTSLDRGAEIIPNSVIPPSERKLRIPDQFFRHDDARERVRTGDIVSLAIIRKAVKKQYSGRIVDVRLLVPKREGLNYLYDVRVLTNSGQLLSVKVDAKSTQIIDVKG